MFGMFRCMRRKEKLRSEVGDKQKDPVMLLNKMDLSVLRQKFRGSVLGALSGDCLGAAYQGEPPMTPGNTVILQKRFDTLEGPEFKAPVILLTDDSVMTRDLSQSLIDKGDLDLLDLAKKFVKSFYQEPNRGYAVGVMLVFAKLRGNKFTDLEGPAKEQFNGQGSFGNGAAMRVSPVSLFCHNNYERLVDMARRQAMLTHTHKDGVNGAILQAIAIEKTISLDPNQELDPKKFIDDLIDRMNNIEKDEEEFLEMDEAEIKPYKTQLIRMKNMIKKSLKNPNRLDVEEVVTNLGTSVRAMHAVPTAIFCFLYAQNPIPGINTDNPFRRAIQYAITLGGDTDTIASMAGAIAGAYYGDERINSNMLKHCECSQDFAKLGDQLFDIVHKQ
ncbi:ADP-ribose glycohydrolase ARH3 isoform X2 [Diachasma alloeum]|nr:ADP-ribose glycohydrolase ARH3 isoform X2 [Diachasma alloeum]XP_015127906.1 ADP-ribose glycohydrolase ARH3 isoform X2 [Diachasma alloeum]